MMISSLQETRQLPNKIWRELKRMSRKNLPAMKKQEASEKSNNNISY